MAKYKKRYYAKKKVLKAIGKYQRRKLNYVTDIYWDGDGNLFFGGEQTNSFIVGEALSGNTSEFQVLGKQYGFVKLRGVAIEVNNVSLLGGYNYGIVLGQANDSIVFSNLRNQPNLLLFDKNTTKRMYCKVGSTFTSTNDIQLFNNVALLPFRQGTGAARWNIKITLYLTLKTNL